MKRRSNEHQTEKIFSYAMRKGRTADLYTGKKRIKRIV